MTQFKVPTTAPNYEVWLTHRIGANPDLSRRIEECIVRGQEFTDAINDELFERFFSNTRLSAQMMETGECIARELAQVLDALKGGGEQSVEYAGSLQAAAKSFETSLDTVMLRDVVAGLAAATRDMAKHNNELFNQIRNSTQQVATLRKTLETVEQQARNDGLTGLANRRSFDGALRARVKDAQQVGRPMCLIMCDIDHFKRFNDTWGHQVGDQVIRFIAQALQRHAPDGAIAARYGGEEFALILPSTNLDDAYAIAETIRQSVKSKKLVRKSTQEAIGVATISMGIAVLHHQDSPPELLARADAALYASKRLGRDRITLETEVAAVAA